MHKRQSRRSPTVPLTPLDSCCSIGRDHRSRGPDVIPEEGRRGQLCRHSTTAITQMREIKDHTLIIRTRMGLSTMITSTQCTSTRTVTAQTLRGHGDEHEDQARAVAHTDLSFHTDQFHADAGHVDFHGDSGEPSLPLIAYRNIVGVTELTASVATMPMPPTRIVKRHPSRFSAFWKSVRPISLRPGATPGEVCIACAALVTAAGDLSIDADLRVVSASRAPHARAVAGRFRSPDLGGRSAPLCTDLPR